MHMLMPNEARLFTESLDGTPCSLQCSIDSSDGLTKLASLYFVFIYFDIKGYHCS